MIFKERSLTFHEFAMNQSVPLSSIQDAVLEFMQDREDSAVFGAQAVNAYVDEPRMSQDVDILTIDAEKLSEEIRSLLNDRFNIAVRVRSVASGKGFRVYQISKPKNRHLVDVREVSQLPPCQRVERILVPTPPQLIGQKVISMVSRSRTAKGMTDIADLRRLLLMFPELKTDHGAVEDALRESGADEKVYQSWQELVAQEIEVEDDDAGY
ncbi:hypothetical protein LF1_23410 [Rubripirellula obstinata]|uniref:Nucleotidyl transferase AbiEii toxin, Type IV TA system n=1 Tax=Rubripirellula obstinata TaxID=406547 RepID=A0A5B1CKF2_9BACT|nr:nucleotidyl transferase AbiEii/AbiGii toxin family protein [Rubripirellula obstinata]KAA1259804.1 hypothetical protein LF1_23410 [Rubripirellula obstinata]